MVQCLQETQGRGAYIRLRGAGITFGSESFPIFKMVNFFYGNNQTVGILNVSVPVS